MFKKCLNCNCEFIPNKYHKNQKFCSDCKILLNKLRNQVYKERFRKYVNQYYQDHKNKILKNRKQHKKEKAIYDKKYRKIQLLTNVIYKIKGYLRRRINHAIKNNSKSKKTIELLGCSVKYLKQHLESLFSVGMSWKNYGKQGWEIDHIRPCASFDLSKPEEQLKCFHYSNLQPLWKKENQIKGDKYVY